MSVAERPVAILQHHDDVGPGYFGDWLGEHRIGYRLLRIDEGDAVPAEPEQFAGICSLGGPMSVNESLPWVAPELGLLRAAVGAGVPVIGHCLGGQLLARALGAKVSRNPVKEIGWGRVTITQPALAREWLGNTPAEIEMFQWHGDAFALPPRATSFLASRWCEHQAFVIEHAGVAHIGMQFHCEATPAIVRQWSGDDSWFDEVQAEREATGGPAVQDAEAMRDDLEARCAAMHVLAARIYARWWRGAAPRAGTDHAAHAVR
ncbi:MAG: type 1 glutamine amidotransferase [Burkholderiales bacterium]|jgi:GMP synthase-like glutamine amidotransferase|nr:type 1 glutamine amidotransferase [Burkholderiales bacterium]